MYMIYDILTLYHMDSFFIKSAHIVRVFGIDQSFRYEPDFWADYFLAKPDFWAEYYLDNKDTVLAWWYNSSNLETIPYSF